MEFLSRSLKKIILTSINLEIKIQLFEDVECLRIFKISAILFAGISNSFSIKVKAA